MRAAVFTGPGRIEVLEVPDARILDSSDAVVRVVRSCICGSDLWRYRGVGGLAPSRIGHEFIGVVEETGSDVTDIRVGDLVVAPFLFNDGTCRYCRSGLPSSCDHGGIWGTTTHDGGQGEAVRVPFADATLIAIPGVDATAEEDLLLSLLSLSDVVATGHHAALAAGVGAGDAVVVVGDGAVGLSAVCAAQRLNAETIVLLGRHPARTAIGTGFGATHVVPERGDEATALVRDILHGGCAHVIEAVGTDASWATAIDVSEPGGRIGYVGVPHGSSGLPLGTLFSRNVTVSGGIAPVRRYLPELVADVLSGSLATSSLFDRTLPLDDVDVGYREMDARTTLKATIVP